MSSVHLSIARRINPRTKLVAKIKSTLSLIAIGLANKLLVWLTAQPLNWSIVKTDNSAKSVQLN